MNRSASRSPWPTDKGRLCRLRSTDPVAIKQEMATSAFGLVGPLATFESAAARLAANKIAGDAFRDEIPGALSKLGYSVRTEVLKPTPFGVRVVDIEVQIGEKIARLYFIYFRRDSLGRWLIEEM